VVEADATLLMLRFAAETDVSARRGLALALGEYKFAGKRPPGWDEFAVGLLDIYRDHPDPGLRAAVGWALQQLQVGSKVAAVDAALAAAARTANPVRADRGWFVNRFGHTYTVVRGPVEFVMGSPRAEPNRVGKFEPTHPKRIGRAFAVAAREVTVADFLRFRRDHPRLAQYSPGPHTPMLDVTWYDAAAYCNWLSGQDGLPPDQWCYEPNDRGEYGPGMRVKPDYLTRTGYRLPTEAEWEYTCRAGTTTPRSFGRGDELVRRYGWFVLNAADQARQVGTLRPNDLGLYDMLGNAGEWVGEPATDYHPGQPEDEPVWPNPVVIEDLHHVIRGGGYGLHTANLRSANRMFQRPGTIGLGVGFRVARTLPE
jgi:formylglycine-generating enzyme required for sulfatase activity